MPSLYLSCPRNSSVSTTTRYVYMLSELTVVRPNASQTHHRDPSSRHLLCTALCRVCRKLLRGRSVRLTLLTVDRCICAQLALASPGHLAAISTLPLGLDATSPSLVTHDSALHKPRSSIPCTTSITPYHWSSGQAFPRCRAVRKYPQRTRAGMGVEARRAYPSSCSTCTGQFHKSCQRLKPQSQSRS